MILVIKMSNHMCDYINCNYSSNLKHNVDRHIQTVHLKQKSFKCDKCDASFTAKESLQRHINSIHLEQCFVCKHCEQSFNCKNNMQRHVNSAHLKMKYKCDKCDEHFSYKSNLLRHVNAIHVNPKPKDMSRGEKIIFDTLEELGFEYGVDFKTEYKFKKLIGIGKRQLRYDFVVFDVEDLLLIEFDGAQHFKAVRYQQNESNKDTQARFEMIKCHDKRKNKFAKQHDYPLLRIKYSDVNNVSELLEEFFKDHSTLLD
jgi:uncharacterized C2H2 Zn-finger protein